jgi:hypothetical protein
MRQLVSLFYIEQAGELARQRSWYGAIKALLLV